LKVSARSALTEGLDSLTFVLIHPKVHLGHKSHARSAQAKESLRVVNLSKHLKTTVAGVRRVEGIQHLEVSESCRKECVQESSLRLRVVRKIRRDKSFEAIKGSTKSWSISSDSRRRRFGSQLIKSRKESLVHVVNVSRRRRTDGQDLVERICGIPPAVRSDRGAGRLRLHSEFKFQGS
jgi:hypothetical protein